MRTVIDAPFRSALRPAPYLTAMLLGLACGLRSQLPMALLARAVARDDFCEGRAIAAPLRGRGGRVATLAGASELVADKLPFVGSRTERGPLVARAVLAGAAGVLVAVDRRCGPVTAAGVAGLAAGAALASARVGHGIRARLARDGALPDPVLGAIEDGVALTIGLVAMRVYQRG